MGATSIEWADKVWNVTTGCTRVSAGCANCYAERFSRRLKGMKKTARKYRHGFRPVYHPQEITRPYFWKKPSCIFISSMGDLFHEAIPLNFIAYVIKVVIDCQRHRFMMLTKRPERMREFFCDYLPHRFDIALSQLDNLWIGVSVENQAEAEKRVPELLKIPTRHRFLSCEPLLDQVSLHLFDMTCRMQSGKRLNELLHLVIIGSETGSGARQMRLCDLVDLTMDCDFLDIPVFIKNTGKNLEDIQIELLQDPNDDMAITNQKRIH
jgi:protein gp37